MKVKKWITIVTVLLLVFVIFYQSSIIFTTSYRKKDNEEVYKDCGYSLTCRYCSSNELEINVNVPASIDDSDYYYHLEGIRCNQKVAVKFVKAKFVNSIDTLNLNIEKKRTSFYLLGKVDPNDIEKNEEIEIIIFLMNGQNQTIKLKRCKNFHIDLPVIKGILESF